MRLKTLFVIFASSLLLSCGGRLVHLRNNPQGGGGGPLERTCIRGQLKDQAAVDTINSEEWLARENPPAKLRDRIWARECSEVFNPPPDNAVGTEEKK